MQPNNIQIYQSPKELTTAAAEFIIELAAAAVKKAGRFSISLSGGHTPQHLYELMATPAYKDRMPWKDTFVFWGDERCVPLDDKDNNARMAIDALLSKVSIPQDNIYRMRTDLPAADAAVTYEKVVTNYFGNQPTAFDLILLGLGDNGHTASLFPDTEVLKEQTRLIEEVYVAEVKMYRITMTLPLINAAQNVLFLVEGQAKSDIISKLFADTAEPLYPAQLVAPVAGKLYWFMDSKAAALLPEQK